MLQRLAQTSPLRMGVLRNVRSAPSATHPETKAEYIRLARGWVHLARSYEFVESLERFLLDATRKRHSLRPRTFQKLPTLYANENRREQKTRSPEKSGLLY